MSSTSSLSTAARVVTGRTPRKHLTPTPCPPASPDKRDRHSQPYIGKAECVSLSGRKRRRHEFEVVTRRGLRCLWCSALQAWKQMGASLAGRGPGMRSNAFLGAGRAW